MWKVLYPSQEYDKAVYAQAKEWGYNALVSTEAIPELGFILKVNLTEEIFPFDEDYREKMCSFIEKLPPCDALLWESPYFALDCRSHLLKHAKLKIELLLEELHTLELSSKPLFYSVPLEFPVKHFTRLEAATGPQTFLLSPSRAPFFRLRLSKSLPIIEGLSEEIPLLLSETGRLLNDLKSGAFIKLDGPLHSYTTCHLEAAVKAMEGSSTFEEAGWAWLKRHRPDVGEERHLMRALAGFAEKARFFKAIQGGLSVPLEEIKMTCESLAAEMKLFYYHLNQKSHGEGKFFEEVRRYLEALTELSNSLK